MNCCSYLNLKLLRIERKRERESLKDSDLLYSDLKLEVSLV